MLRFTSTLLAWLAVAGLACPAADPAVLRIGLTGSLMEDIPPSRRDTFSGEFNGLVRDFTGLKSLSVAGLDPWTSAQQVAAGKWDVGVFQGVEFAWVRAKYPKLQPFMVATQDVPVKAVLVMDKDGKFTGFGDLKGKNVVMLRGKLHCRLFADKGVGGKANGFFGKLTLNRSAEDSLDDVLLHKMDAAIVDTVALNTYKNLVPGRFKRLKILAESQVFPPAAIVSERGVLSDKLLKTLTDGMLKANQNDRGRETLTAFHIKGFDPVPADYEKQLESILKAYPPENH